MQYNQFQQFINRSQIIREKGGVFKNLLPKKEYFSKALYTIDIGQNDISMGILTHMSKEQIKESMPDTINRLITHLKKLYNLG
ncbi:SGNH/GDSL hydrolase family protein, partial [Staphylococcus aureus]